MSWVLRTAKARRECSNCWGFIPTEERYFLLMDGTILCCECPPEYYEGESICHGDS